MSFTPYLSFQAECAEAFMTYGQIFGVTPQLHRFSDMPDADNMPPLPDEQKGWIMHARLLTPEGSLLMGEDMPPQFGGTTQSGVSVSFWKTRPEDARALFERLSEGGKITMPFSETFFSKGFGMCCDRFGTNWMISTGDPAVLA